VVEACAALGVVKHTGRVELEAQLVGLDGNRQGLLHEGSLHIDGALGRNPRPRGHVDARGVVGIVGAWLIDTGVRICGLAHGVELAVVVESVLLQTTVAAEVAPSEASAVNKLLLGEGKKLSRGNEVRAFEGTRR